MTVTVCTFKLESGGLGEVAVLLGLELVDLGHVADVGLVEGGGEALGLAEKPLHEEETQVSVTEPYLGTEDGLLAQEVLVDGVAGVEAYPGV